MAERRKRTAKIIVPAILAALPNVTYTAPDLQGDLPDPHSYYSQSLISQRPNLRSHQRIILLTPERKTRYVQRKVDIETTRRDFDPYETTWQRYIDGWRITHHFRPERKIEKSLNERHRDWKHRRRQDPDDSRADALRAIPYRWAKYRDYMQGAFDSEDPRIVADTAIVLNQLIKTRRL